MTDFFEDLIGIPSWRLGLAHPPDYLRSTVAGQAILRGMGLLSSPPHASSPAPTPPPLPPFTPPADTGNKSLDACRQGPQNAPACSDSPSEGYWSLALMFARLGPYLTLLGDLQALEADWRSRSAGQFESTLSDEGRARLKKIYDELGQMADACGFPTLAATTAHGLAELPTVTVAGCFERFKQLRENYTWDGNKKYFWIVHNDKAEYFGGSFGEPIDSVFPDALWEIREAGSCYALGRSTASVFHLMRAVEVGMRTLSEALGVPRQSMPIEYQDWQVVIQNIEAAAKGVEAWGQCPERTNARQFFKRVVADLHAFKDDTRNVMMHTRDTPYDSPAAIGVRNRVREWFGLVGAKMEPGMSTGALLDKSLFAP